MKHNVERNWAGKRVREVMENCEAEKTGKKERMRDLRGRRGETRGPRQGSGWTRWRMRVDGWQEVGKRKGARGDLWQALSSNEIARCSFLEGEGEDGGGDLRERWEPSRTRREFEAAGGAGGIAGRARGGVQGGCSVHYTPNSHVAQLPLASCISAAFSEGLLIVHLCHSLTFFSLVVYRLYRRHEMYLSNTRHYLEIIVYPHLPHR